MDWKSLSAWASTELARPEADDRVLDLAIMLDPDSMEVGETLQRTLVACGIGRMDGVRAAEIELAESANDVLAGTNNVLSVARRLNAVWGMRNHTGDVLNHLHNLVSLYDEPFEEEPMAVGDLRDLQAYFLGLASPWTAPS
ncbi:hypothetical protein E3O68_01430 [Cryobacterium sp. TMB3-1-2]|uniref:hypothetical protein n=1 Tax=Cryobacterium sp. TMB3-10 TaxID=1259209 RepID=UPI001100633B|nr:hypothetical protein [Cryobacterium sp. TMB3-10]TFC58637.1 hypothetical protein E3O68_01430 [Cryobacterium sp. TMB3-1-2]